MSKIKMRLEGLGLKPYTYKPKWGQTRWVADVECPQCGVVRRLGFDKILYKAFPRPCFKCSRTFKNGAEHPNWVGGVHMGVNGYSYMRIYEDNPFYCMAQKGGYIKVSRYVMAQKLGRVLEQTEIVHHVNGNKADDRPENLMLMESSSAHSKIEYTLREIGEDGRLKPKI